MNTSKVLVKNKDINEINQSHKNKTNSENVEQKLMMIKK